MKAKYQGTCRACRGRIQVGDDIVYDKERGARHPGCKDRQEKRPQTRRRGQSLWDQAEPVWDIGMSVLDLDADDFG